MPEERAQEHSMRRRSALIDITFLQNTTVRTRSGPRWNSLARSWGRRLRCPDGHQNDGGLGPAGAAA